MRQTFVQRQRKRRSTRERAEEYAAYEIEAQETLEGAHKVSERSAPLLADVQAWLDRH